MADMHAVVEICVYELPKLLALVVDLQLLELPESTVQAHRLTVHVLPGQDAIYQ